jgi:2-polyprenyl-3-methyl-5-hydroxy-6-metoxy-1,4-benzoquinol methylase
VDGFGSVQESGRRKKEVLTNLQCRILKRISPGEPGCCSGEYYKGRSKLAVLLGDEFLARIEGKVVIDFGCGEGTEAVEMALRGARRVIGLDIRQDALQVARQKAAAAGVENACCFATSTKEAADIVVSVDAFEHYQDPSSILRTMSSVLKPDGEVLASFGPPWRHPLGGHSFSLFPWAHLLFSEEALLRWRATFKQDGATRFQEVAGGLNQLTIRRFEKLIANSPFEFADFQLTPIRRLRAFHNRWTREFTTSLVRCRLVGK